MQKFVKRREQSQESFIIIHPRDNVAMALRDIERGTRLTLVKGRHTVDIVVSQKVPFGHKFATERIGKSQPVRKYGEMIGKATKPIRIGEWIHTHNLESVRGRYIH